VVELLVIIGIVIGVISTLVVGLSIATRRARGANTEFLMNSIASALSRFKSETGYLPLSLGDPQAQLGVTPATARGTGAVPTTGWARDVINAAGFPLVNEAPSYGAWSADQRRLLQRAGSATALPEFLLGPGDRSADGYGWIFKPAPNSTDMNAPGWREQPVLGIRNPGQDGCWGALTNPRPTPPPQEPPRGLFRQRNLAMINGYPDNVTGNPAENRGNSNRVDSTSTFQNSFLKGKSLGPYLEVKSDSDVGALVGFDPDGRPQVARAGEVPEFDAYPKVLLDYFGNPIMYYRRGFVNSDPRQFDKSWTLADIVALRPSRFGSGDDFDSLPDLNNDSSALRAARAAEFGLFSAGPDKQYDPFVRADASGFNEDNIVRFGP
jgi:type II secretory pathway pseudopilin PulG